MEHCAALLIQLKACGEDFLFGCTPAAEPDIRCTIEAAVEGNRTYERMFRDV